jgi:3-oxoacyl-[acyl-carrier-protein] synthase II
MPERDARSSFSGVPFPAKRVVITGIGAITPIGSGRDGLWQGVRAGQSAAKRIKRFDASEFR